jgi:hypothetical protein
MSNIKYHSNSSSKSFHPIMNQSDKIDIDSPNKTVEVVPPTQGTDPLTLYGGYAEACPVNEKWAG